MSYSINNTKIGIILISTIIIISLFNSVSANDSPVPCSPYPMCKLFDENEKMMTDPLRLNQPSEVDIETIRKQRKEANEQTEELVNK